MVTELGLPWSIEETNIDECVFNSNYIHYLEKIGELKVEKKRDWKWYGFCRTKKRRLK